MRAKARQRFLAEYTGERNFSLLVNIYQGAMCSGSSVYPVPASPGHAPCDVSGALKICESA